MGGGAEYGKFSLSRRWLSLCLRSCAIPAFVWAIGLTVSTANAATSARCKKTFKTAELVFSASATGDVTALPPVNARCAAPTLPPTYYLRVVHTGKKTDACLNTSTASTVEKVVKFGYQCSNPTRCSTGSKMVLSGTEIAANAAGQTSSTQDLTLKFEANGSAPFTFDYFNDAGNVTLFATLPAKNALASDLSAETSFVVAPDHFALSGIPAAPLTAGDPFNVTVTAQNACNATTPNFGAESSPAVVTLSSSNPLPAQGNAVNISTEFHNFNRGVASTTSSWGEVGTIDLTATTMNYLGSGLAISAPPTTVGRFRPAYFEVTDLTPGCGSVFTYSGQEFRSATVKAKEAGGAVTKNHDASYLALLTTPLETNRPKVVTLSETSEAAGILFGATIAQTQFSAGVASPSLSFRFSAKLTAPTQIALRATGDALNTNAPSYSPSHALIRSGRLVLFSAAGSEKSELLLPVQTQFWSGKDWVINSDDSCTVLPADSFALTGDLAKNTWVSTRVELSAGLANIRLKAPAGGARGSVNVAANLGNRGSDNSCQSPHGGEAAQTLWLRWRNGSCTTPDENRDPSARATFGIYSPETRRAIYVQENF